MTTVKYRVSWDIDIELEDDNPMNAASEAFRLVTKPDTTANVFIVENINTGAITTVDLMEQTAEVQPMHSIKILWGSHPEPDQEPKLYEFNRKEDFLNFMDGVEEASGWLEYEVIE